MKSSIYGSRRALIAKLARASKGSLIGIKEASIALEVAPKTVAIKLASLAKTGWLLRVKRGLYFIVPLEATPGKKTMSDDPWLLAHASFSPCYIGGWSAAEHWGLTEQLFRSTLVLTSMNIRSKSINLLDHEFRLFQVPASRMGGTVSVWHGNEQIQISDREKTLVDCLRNPELCGGARHLADIMSNYSEDKTRDFVSLIAKAKLYANGAAWKRLGYLSELLWPDAAKDVIAEAQKNLTTGNIKLDPNIKTSGHLVNRWHVFVNVTKLEQETV